MDIYNFVFFQTLARNKHDMLTANICQTRSLLTASLTPAAS